MQICVNVFYLNYPIFDKFFQIICKTIYDKCPRINVLEKDFYRFEITLRNDDSDIIVSSLREQETQFLTSSS